MLAALLTFQSAGITAQAESDTAQLDNVRIEDIQSIDTLNIEDISGGDATDAMLEETGEEILPAGTLDGEDIVNTPVEESLFPGLPESYELSAEQKEQKRILSEHTGGLAPYQSEDNTNFYAKGELVYLTDSEEEAQLVAEAFGGTLDRYDLGVAVIRLSEDRTVSQAVLCAASDDYKLPAVWPNYYKKLYATYSDPALSEANDYQWQHAFVGDIYAWEAGYKGQGVKVGVIDSGVLSGHEEFADGKLVQHLSMISDPAEASTIDVNGHGTHVSGIVAANLNNGKGGAGIAPEAALYVYGVGTKDGAILADAEFRGINQAIKDGLDVINLSLGSGWYDENENIVLQNAYKAGIAIFAAAGNEATNGKSYPASYDNVCSIAALQQDGKKATYTNYNDSVDLAFPGTDIYSTYNEGADSYTYMDGTSMACPVATGVAAVILSGASKVPELAGKTGTAKVDALYKVMAENAKKCPSAGTGAGTTWLPSVFNLKAESASAIPAVPVFNVGNKLTLNSNYLVLTITSDTTLGVDIYYSTNGKSPALKDGKVTNGTLYTGPVTVGGAKKVTVKAIAVNILTGKASKVATGTYTFTPDPNGVNIISNEVHRLALGSSLALKASATPSYAVSSKIKWSVAPEGKGVTVSTSGKVSVAKTATAGNFTVTATAVDKKGNVFKSDGKPVAATYSIEVVDLKNSVKSIVLAEKKASVAKGNSKNLAEGIVVTYGDGTPGTAGDVAWSSSNKKIATVDKDGVVTGKAPGKVTIKATANDGTGKSASCTVTVLQLATKLKISGSSKLVAGKSVTLKASLSPSNVSSKSLEWSVTGTGVTVKNGKVSASKTASGSYTVTAKTTDGSNLTDSIDISIISDPIKKITLPKTMNLFTTSGNFNAPTAQALTAKVDGGDSTAITFTSSAPDVATVDSKGIVRAVASGKTKITCTATDGSNKKAVCTVTVTVPMSSLTIIPAEDNDGIVSVGSTLKLKAQVGNSFGTPQNAKVKWSVPETYKDIISVSASGAVKAKSIGKNASKDTDGVYAYVMAEAADGSGAAAVYKVAVIRKIAAFAFIKERGYLVPAAMLDNGHFFNVPYNTTVSGPKGRNIGYQATDLGGLSCFILTTDEATTNKTSAQQKSFTVRDGIKVTVKVKLQTGNKSGSQSIILIKTADDALFSM